MVYLSSLAIIGLIACAIYSFVLGRKIVAVNKLLIESNRDILNLLNMNLEISKVVDSHSKVIIQHDTILGYIIDKESKTNTKETTNIFEPPHGQA